MNTQELGALGAAAARQLLTLRRSVADRALSAIIAALAGSREEILAANAEDLERAGDLSSALRKRLRYDAFSLEASLTGLEALRRLADPLGRVHEARELDEGLVLRRVSCPIGLVAMVFEARPDALVQMAGLAVKSGNALVVKGGREAARSNEVLTRIIAGAGEGAGLPAGWLQALSSRGEVDALLCLDEFVDLVIPRGSKEFVRSVMERSRIPVLGHSDGVCHVYVHEAADLEVAERVAVDSKAQYPAACNAAEVLLVDRAVSAAAIPRLARALEGAGVALELCPESAAILAALPPGAHNASMESPFGGEGWSVEYLDWRMAVKVVDSLDAAIAHVNRWGSGHTDAIVTAGDAAAARFMAEVDSASVYRNASTRFADGYRYGLGAEVGISTGKLHARGPMGVDGLLTSKWLLEGSGQVVADYVSGKSRFTHRELPGERN